MSGKATTGRIVSMDQFRGYTVAGMFVVNFLGGLEVIPKIFKHNNTFFSYADSIMPSFMFAVGFSYRLTMLRRLEKQGVVEACHRVIIRSLALVLFSLAVFGIGETIQHWNEATPLNASELVAKLLKANMWEVLAIIGVAQLLILPVVAARPWVRILTIIAFMVAHTVLSWSFNYEFVYGRPNWMDAYFGAAGKTAWDGGFFGVLMWSVPMLAGTLAYDILVSASAEADPVRRLFGWGVALMVLGYALSCLSTLYDLPGGPGQVLTAFLAEKLNPTDEQKKQVAALQSEVDGKLGKILTEEQTKQLKKPGARAAPGQLLTPSLQESLKLTAQQKTQVAELQSKVDSRLAKLLTDEQNKELKDMREGIGRAAVSPVLPPFGQLGSRPITSYLADPPFVEPPSEDVRKKNYWMMDKRIVTVTFTLFATGFALALYGLFVVICDGEGKQLNLFRMLGQNPLAAYVLHEMVARTVHPVVPKDSPLPWCLIGLLVFFAITMMLVRYLDRHKIYVRL